MVYSERREKGTWAYDQERWYYDYEVTVGGKRRMLKKQNNLKCLAAPGEVPWECSVCIQGKNYSIFEKEFII